MRQTVQIWICELGYERNTVHIPFGLNVVVIFPERDGQRVDPWWTIEGMIRDGTVRRRGLVLTGVEEIGIHCDQCNIKLWQCTVTCNLGL